MRKKIILSLLGALTCVGSIHSQNSESLPPFALITVPKAGSHLVMKALYFLTGTEAIWHTKFPSNYYLPRDFGFLYTHFCLSEQLEADYKQLPKMKKVIMIRDLRDVAVSIVNQIKKNHWPGLNFEQRQEFLSLPFEQQLLFVIDYEFDVKKVAMQSPNSLQVSLIKIAEQALSYYQDPQVFTCRYENLVGEEGGGSFDLQMQELKDLCRFIEIEKSERELAEVCSLLYGDEVNPFGKQGFKNFKSTFRSGKIGSWKQYFGDDHKEAFKKRIGKYLIAFGYETSDEW